MIGSMVKPRLAQTFLLSGNSYAAIVAWPREGRSGDLCPRLAEAWIQLVGGGGVGTRPWWLALLTCGGAYWPLALEPSAMTSWHLYYCGHPHCCGHPPAWVGIHNATSAHGVLP